MNTLYICGTPVNRWVKCWRMVHMKRFSFSLFFKVMPSHGKAMVGVSVQIIGVVQSETTFLSTIIKYLLLFFFIKNANSWLHKWNLIILNKKQNYFCKVNFVLYCDMHKLCLSHIHKHKHTNKVVHKTDYRNQKLLGDGSYGLLSFFWT